MFTRKYHTRRKRQCGRLITVIMLMIAACTFAPGQQGGMTAIKTAGATGPLIRGSASVGSVTKVQDLSFGMFYVRSGGGTVTVHSDGSRTATGDVVLIPSGPGSPAVFQFVADNTNLVTLTVGSITPLSNGSGGSMAPQISEFYPEFPFIPLVGQNSISVGGTLSVGSQSSNPAGSYLGSFDVTINQQ